jgi:hypothetical protein
MLLLLLIILSIFARSLSGTTVYICCVSVDCKHNNPNFVDNELLNCIDNANKSMNIEFQYKPFKNLVVIDNCTLENKIIILENRSLNCSDEILDVFCLDFNDGNVVTLTIGEENISTGKNMYFFIVILCSTMLILILSWPRYIIINEKSVNFYIGCLIIIYLCYLFNLLLEWHLQYLILSMLVGINVFESKNCLKNKTIIATVIILFAVVAVLVITSTYCTCLEKLDAWKYLLYIEVFLMLVFLVMLKYLG